VSESHYIVFVGPSQPLADELRRLDGRGKGLLIIASPARERGVTPFTIKRAIQELVNEMNKRSMEETARLSIWAYEPVSAGSVEDLLNDFGTAAWIEFVPRRLKDKDRQSRLYIEGRIDCVVQYLHEVSHQVWTKRSRSPFPLPQLNFQSKHLGQIREGRWYAHMDLDEIKSTIKAITDKFLQHHSARDLRAHQDEKNLLFAAAPANICHGQPHPVGATPTCFIKGRFRFGASLFPGHHYDVRPRQGGNLTVTLRNCDGTSRNMSSEKRAYINVFPNDHLLPAHRQTGSL
jgi:hypothetical protein